MSDTVWPQDHEARLITERDWDHASAYSDKEPDVDSRVPYRNVIECTNAACGRLWVAAIPSSNEYKAFKPENGPLRVMDETSS